VSKDTQGVNSGSDKLVTQPSLPGNTARSMDSALGFKGVVQAGAPGNTVTNRDTMCLVEGACPPGKEPHGASRS